MHPDFRQFVNLADPLEREWNEGRYRLPLPLPGREGGIEALDWFGETSLESLVFIPETMPQLHSLTTAVLML